LYVLLEAAVPVERCGFGSIKDAVWAKLEAGLSAKLSDKNLLKETRIEVNLNNWTVSLDAYSANGREFTRIRAPFRKKSDIKFKIFHKDFYSTFIKLFGMEDIVLGTPVFDETFIIQGNNPGKIALLFSDKKVQSLMLKENSLLFQLKEDEGWFQNTYKDGVEELYLETEGSITTLTRLRSFYEIFATVLSLLCDLDPACKEMP